MFVALFFHCQAIIYVNAYCLILKKNNKIDTTHLRKIPVYQYASYVLAYQLVGVSRTMEFYVPKLEIVKSQDK